MLAADLSRVHIVPVVVDTDAADESVVWISADDGPLGVELAGWVGLVISVPLGVLHASFGSVSAAAFVQVRQVAATERSLVSSSDMIIGGYAHIAAVIGRLSAAKWAEAPAQDPIDLRKRAQDLGISVATLAQGLAVAPGEVTELFRGQRVPSPTEVEALASILQIDVLKLSRTPTIPEDMKRSIERPACRPPPGPGTKARDLRGCGPSTTCRRPAPCGSSHHGSHVWSTRLEPTHRRTVGRRWIGSADWLEITPSAS